MTGRRFTRLLGFLVVLLGLAIAPATGAGAHDALRAVATHEAHASPVRRADHTPASTAPRAVAACGLTGRRAHLGQVPLVADLASGSSAPGNHPGRRIAADSGNALHESSAFAPLRTRSSCCLSSPPAARATSSRQDPGRVMTLEQLPTRPPEFARPNVVLLRWPAQEQLREQLEAEGRPRLLLLTRECLAPVCADDLEDWVREPLDSDELERRGRTLERRARIRGLRPRVDEHGLIRVGERWVDLPAAQLPVARLLVANLGRVVGADAIQSAYVDAGGSIHPKAVKAMISRVKRRLAEVDLVLTNVRDRGYVLEATPPE